MTAARPHGFALVDLENQTIWNGARLPIEAASMVVSEIDHYVTTLPTIAALAPSLLRPYVPLLSQRGWGLELVSPGPDAADLALLELGKFAIARGYTDLVIVSGDHAFTELAAHARLHIITHADRLSRNLASAATSVTHLYSGLGAPVAA